MWRLLLQAGAGLATFNLGVKIARIKRVATCLAIAGVIGLLGLGALTAAAVVALEPRLGPIGAAACVGGVLLLVAALIAWIGTREPSVVKPTPIVDRVRSEVGAAGAAFAASRATKSDREPALPPAPGARRKRAINMVLIATLAGIVLGRRL